MAQVKPSLIAFAASLFLREGALGARLAWHRLWWHTATIVYTASALAAGKSRTRKNVSISGELDV